jgi:hypothetical protein
MVSNNFLKLEKIISFEEFCIYLKRNSQRIKAKLKGLSPVNFRTQSI